MANLNSSRRSAAPGATGSHVLPLTLVVLAALFTVSVVAVGHDVVTWFRGMSFDFPYYLWRTNLVSSTGLESLASSPIPGIVVNPDRPGFAVVTSLIGSAMRVDLVALVRVVQLATTLAISLAAGAFAVDILEEPRWSLPLYVLVTGVSAQVAWTSIRSLDNLLIDAVLLAVAVASVGSVKPGRGRAAAIAGLAAAAVIHWFFSLLFILLLAGVAILLIPLSLSARRQGTPIFQTPAVTMGITVGGGAIAAAAAVFGLAPGLPMRLPPAIGNKGNEVRLPSFRLPFTSALAALGAMSLWRPDDVKRRTGLALLVLWGISIFVAQLISRLVASPIKIFRVAGFDLAIPMLGAAALVGAVRLGWRFGPFGRVAAAVTVAAGLLGLVSIGAAIYRSPESSRTASRLEQVRLVAGYVDSIPDERAVVFISTLPNPHNAYHIILAGLPGDRIDSTYLYVGDAEDLLAGGVGAKAGDPDQAHASEEWWKEAWGNADEILSTNPVLIYLSEFNATGASPPVNADILAPGAWVLNAPSAGVPATPSEISTTGRTIALQVFAALLLLGLVGSGWTRWLLPVGPVGWCALSPAVGIGALALLGTAVGKMGGPLGGIGGLAILIATAVLGWIPPLTRHILGRARAKAVG